ncbi:hypothetical protein NA56DRAFT_200410 [Hyaloscypha hepaticicola]|uniref:Uncharacterized protein n=1 Tax=Hyaloscypha hepaticicola TaxID=2082293 RepID=A0A2J6PZA1_9HELO|nr:hypothetical protein NA56DRAFT_200410 [Hyaloscypha hepaticicola]
MVALHGFLPSRRPLFSPFVSPLSSCFSSALLLSAPLSSRPDFSPLFFSPPLHTSALNRPPLTSCPKPRADDPLVFFAFLVRYYLIVVDDQIGCLVLPILLNCS